MPTVEIFLEQMSRLDIVGKFKNLEAKSIAEMSNRPSPKYPIP